MKRNRAWRRRNIQRDRLAAALKEAVNPTPRWEHMEHINAGRKHDVAFVDEVGSVDGFNFIESIPTA